MGFRSQQNTSVIVNIIYWTSQVLGSIPWEAALKPRLHDTSHTFHQALEENISQRIALKPRLFIPSYNYRSSNIHKRQSGLLRTPDGYSGWLLRMATPDGYSGWLLRMATPYGYAGHRGSQYPPQGPVWPWGNYLQDFLSPLFRFCLHLRLPD